MLSSQITVGATYAVTTWGNFNPNTQAVYSMSGLTKAVVLSSPKRGQVTVQFPNSGITMDISTRRFVALWNDYAKERNAYLADKAEAKQRNTDRASRIPTYVPEGTHLPYWADGKVFNDGSQTTKGSLSLLELEALLKAAFEHGQASR